MRPATLIVVSTILVAASPIAAALADQSRFSTGRIGVIPAADFLNEAGPASFTAGAAEMRFTVRTTTDARAFQRKGFEIRIFRTSPTGEVQQWASFDPCLVYFANTVADTDAESEANVINLGPPNRTWLNWSGSNPSPGYFVLVFETKSRNDHLLRLNKNDARQYFLRGLRVKVSPGDLAPPSQTDLLREQQATAKDHADAIVNGPQFPCYQLQAPATGVKRIASLEMCGSLDSRYGQDTGAGIKSGPIIRALSPPIDYLTFQRLRRS